MFLSQNKNLLIITAIAISLCLKFPNLNNSCITFYSVLICFCVTDYAWKCIVWRRLKKCVSDVEMVLVTTSQQPIVNVYCRDIPMKSSSATKFSPWHVLNKFGDFKHIFYYIMSLLHQVQKTNAKSHNCIISWSNRSSFAFSKSERINTNLPLSLENWYSHLVYPSEASSWELV